MSLDTQMTTFDIFSPLNNTPPYCLTQDLPVETNAKILLLGCGDARNILFTCYADRQRMLDVTTCDIEAAIQARNALLFTFIIDRIDETAFEELWSFHIDVKIEQPTATLIESQANKLLEVSATLRDWHRSKYGSRIRFCDQDSLTDVRACWKGYAAGGFGLQHTIKRQQQMKEIWEKARRRYQELKNKNVFSVRSVSPVLSHDTRYLKDIRDLWWDHGNTNSALGKKNIPLQLNPTFYSTFGQQLTINYGTEPLTSFPLATALTSLCDDSIYGKQSSFAKPLSTLVAHAQIQFRAWCKALRESLLRGSEFRLCVADALMFAMKLDSYKQHGAFNNVYRYNGTMEPLVLDPHQYSRISPGAPIQFDVVDASKLFDHLGPLNVLSVGTQLLKPAVTSVLNTDCLFPNTTAKLDDILGCDSRLLLLLLGLFIIESCVNVSHTVEMDLLLQSMRPFNTKPGQHRTRLSFRRVPIIQDVQSMELSIDQAPLTALLAQVFWKMVSFEDPAYWEPLLRNPDAEHEISLLQQKSRSFYTRASFALLIRAIKKNVDMDWESLIPGLERLMYSKGSALSLVRHYSQELSVYLCIIGISHMSYVQSPVRTLVETPGIRRKLGAWYDLPNQVCVTLKVPRRILDSFITGHPEEMSSPSMRCSIKDETEMWEHPFSAVQLSFGVCQTTQEDNEPVVHVQVDPSRWAGRSDMLLSFYSPTWMIAEIQRVPTVSCCFLPTLSNVKSFYKYPGTGSDFYSQQITSTNVMISRYMPNMQDYPTLPTIFTKISELEKVPRLGIKVNPNSTALRLVNHISITDIQHKARLSEKDAKVEVNILSPFEAFIRVGATLNFRATFPLPVAGDKSIVRVARKSSYIEVEAPVINPLDKDINASVLVPLQHSLQCSQVKIPVPWLLKRLDLDAAPSLALNSQRGLQWLIPHLSMMWSNQEKGLPGQDVDRSSRTGRERNPRMEFKEGLNSVLMQTGGSCGQKVRITTLTKTTSGDLDMQIMLLPSRLRLDLSSHTVALDCAAIPLTKSIVHDPRAQLFFSKLNDMMLVKVTDRELNCWRDLLPIFAERCRGWSHRKSCEYAAESSIPLHRKGHRDGFSPICSCGIGKFPRSYVEDLKGLGLLNLDYVLGTYATRVAVSPLFPSPFVEDILPKFGALPDNIRQSPTRGSGTSSAFAATAATSTAVAPIAATLSQSSSKPSAESCRRCGKQGGSSKTSHPGATTNTKDNGHEGPRLGPELPTSTSASTSTSALNLGACQRCGKAKYCSRSCQRADWKMHKPHCVPQA